MSPYYLTGHRRRFTTVAEGHRARCVPVDWKDIVIFRGQLGTEVGMAVEAIEDHLASIDL